MKKLLFILISAFAIQLAYGEGEINVCSNHVIYCPYGSCDTYEKANEICTNTCEDQPRSRYKFNGQWWYADACGRSKAYCQCVPKKSTII